MAAAAAGKAAAVVVVPAVVRRLGCGEEEMMMMVGSAASEPRRRCGGVTEMVARSDEDGGEDGVKILAGKDGGSPEKSAGKVFPAAAAGRRLEREGRGFLSCVCFEICYNEKI
ncbi:hypothetical protein Tco_0661760 [Tanacetum coccineum]